MQALHPTSKPTDLQAGNKSQGPSIWNLAAAEELRLGLTAGAVLRHREAVMAVAAEEDQAKPEAVADAPSESAVLTALEGLLNLELLPLKPDIAPVQDEGGVASPVVVV